MNPSEGHAKTTAAVYSLYAYGLSACMCLNMHSVCAHVEQIQKQSVSHASEAVPGAVGIFNEEN